MSPPDNLERPAPRGDEEIAASIEQLASDEAPVRERAALGIFARGRERALRAAGPWFGDAEIAACFAFDDLGFPRTTVGIAVQAATFERIRTANGMTPLAQVPADIDAREFELDWPGGVRVDVLTARNAAGGGPIARFIEKHGEGIQQVELEVRDVERATELLRGRFGLNPVYANARSGADGTCVNFFLLMADGNGKLLIELVETPGKTA